MSSVSSTTVILRLLGASLLTLSACSSRGESPSPETTEIAEVSTATLPKADFAMAYEATEQELDIRAAQELVRKTPTDAMAYVSLAEAFLVRKRETSNARYFALASDAMGAARGIAPNNSAVRTSAVQLLFADHQFEEAAAETRKLIASNASNATAYLLLSDALVEQGQYDDAVEALEGANDISPDLRVYARGSYLRWLDGDQEGAIELMVDAIKMGSKTNEAVAWCYAELGMLFWHTNQLDEATSAATRANNLVPGYAPATELMARIAATEGKRDEAIVLYEQLVERRSTVSAHIALSELLRLRGSSDQAEAQRTIAEEMAVHDPLALALHDARYGLNPAKTLMMAEKAVAERSNIYTRDALALALLRAGKIAEARVACGDEAAFGGLDASLWLHRGLVQAADGDAEAARTSLDKALTLNAAVDPLLVAELQSELTKGRLL